MSILTEIADFVRDPSLAIPVAVSVIYVVALSIVVKSPSLRRSLIRSVGLFTQTLANALLSLVGVSEDNAQSQRSGSILAEENIARPRASRFKLSDTTERSIVSLFETAINNTLTEEIKLALDAVVTKTVKEENIRLAVGALQRVLFRLQSASSTVTIRGFVNLTIGIAFASWALYILKGSLEIFSPTQLSTITTNAIVYFIGMRFSLGVVITLISYFFLSLYKRSLDEAKYYQNEMTTVSGHITAMSLLERTDSEAIKSYVISCLMEYDRNSLETKASQTEESKFSSEVIKALLDKLPSLKVS